MLLAALMWGHASPVHAAPPRSGPDATPASGAETGTGTPGTGLATVPAQATEELDWAEMARELGDATKRQATLDELRTVQPFPAAAWVALLSHSDLSVRMGALEVLEDLAGADLDFDPWETDRTVQAEALARWQAWARSGAGKAPLVAAGAALHPEQLRDYLQDILAGDAAKAERSITKLRPYANQVIGEIERFLTEQSTLLDGARGRLKEAQYRLLLEGSPAAGDAARLARMLVFGNRDERVEGLEGISKAGSRCLPILREKLTDRDALVRERALDIFFEAGGTGGLPHIEAHLAKEKDENVIHAAIRGFGKTESAISTRLLTGYLNHENEDLVAAALLSLSLQKTAAKAAKSQILNCTKNPSWRVRAAALQCAAKAQLGPLPAEAVALLKDEDSFVRQAAVLAIAAGSGSRGGGAFDSGLGGILSKVVGGGSGGTTTDALCDAFEADDELKGTVIKAFAQMEKPLPDRIVKQFPKLSPELLAFGLSNFRTHESSSLELLLRYAMDANPDIACSALRVLAREKPLMEEVEPLLASVLAGGDRARQEAVVEYLEFYPFENKPNRRAMEEALQELTAGQSPAPVAPAVPHAGAVDPAPTKAAVPASPADRLHEAFFGGTRPAGEKAAAPEPAAAAPAPPSLAERLREAFLSVAAPSVSQDPTVRTDIPAGPAPVATASRVGPGSLEAALDALAATSSAPTGQGSTLAILAAQRLIEGGYAVGAHHFVRWWPALNVQHRAELASALSRQPRPGTLALWQRLLRDPSREIRRKAVASAFYEEEIPAPIKLVFLELLRKDTPLEAADLYQSRLESLSSQTETRTMMAEQARLLMADGRADRQVLACIMLGNRIRTADEALLASASVSPHFWVRRAAIYSMGRRNRALLEERAGVLASDTSAWVREALPVSLIPTGWAWHHHFDDNTSLENESYDSSPPPNRGLSEPLIAVLRQLATDREDHVRLAAMTALLTHREEVQLPTFLDLLDRAPNRTELSVALADFVENHYHRLGKGLLPLVGKLDWSKTPPDRYAAVQRHFGHEAAQSRADFAAYVTAGAEGGKAPASSEPQFSPEGVHSSAAAAAAGDGERDLSQAPVTVHFFHNPGCHECDRVRKDLASLAREFKGMKVQEHNIRDPEAVLLNEALSRRFGIPPDQRLKTPAVFLQSGVLMTEEVKYPALHSRVEEVARAGETDVWHQMQTEDLAEAKVEVAQRVETLQPAVIFFAGLLDGVNPCAFATIIFLLSYLQVAKRTSREILLVGCAFILGVFITYFVLGLGLVEVVSRLTALKSVGLIVNWILAIGCLVVAVISWRDARLARQGRLQDMTLQLPGFLKDRIRGVIRTGTRVNRFVIAAFFSGVVISVLELACTGQVYLPTIVYAMNSGARNATGFLLVYNIAFIIPLATVFALAWGGLRSEALIRFQHRHTATVKYALAVLFAVLFFVLLTSGRL